MNKKLYTFALLVSALLLFFTTQQERTDEPVPISDKLATKLAPSDFLYLTRNYPDGAPEPKAIRQEMQLAKGKMSTRANLPGFGGNWTQQGPGNIGGRINSVTVHPQNPQIRFVGTNNGGIWKTTDGGQNWRPVFDDQPNLAIADIEYDVMRPDTMFAATGDPNIPGYVYVGEGVYRSVDGGDTWQYLGLKNEGIISKVWVKPNDPNIILAGVMGYPMRRSMDRGMYRSTDAGQNWTRVLSVSNQAGIIDLIQDPRNPDVLFASSWDRIRTARESIVEGPGAGVWKSTDAGATWVQSTNGLPSGDMGRIGLTASKATPNTFFALYVGTDRQLAGIYKTSNAGTSWSQVKTDSVNPNALGGFGWYFGKIGVNPADDDELYVLGVDLHSTTDGGLDWDLATPPWWFYDVHADKHDIHFITPDHILLATDGGLFETTNHGGSWAKIENIPNTQFYRIAHNPHQPTLYYGGAQDNGSTGGNASNINFWERIWGGDGFQMRFHPTDPDTWWVETQNGNISYTTDGGIFYDRMEFGLDEDERSNWDGPLLLSQHDPSVLYHARQRVYRASGGAGSTWDSISTILTSPDTTLLGSSRTISSLAESPHDADVLYAGAADGLFWVSTDYGVNWTERSGTLPDRYITDIFPSPTFPSTVYVTHSGFRYNDFFSHIHRSDDYGQTWTDVSGDLPPIPVNSLFILDNTNDSLLVAATNAGIFASADAGLRWEPLGDMLAIPVFDLGINPAQDELVAGTHARSIQTYPLDSLRKAFQVITQLEKPFAVSSLRMYPNPASDYVMLDLPLDQLASAHAEIYSPEGKLMIEKGLQGENRLSLEGLNSGVYTLKVRTSEGLYTGKFIKK